jgi:hypothetical protein
MTQADFDRLPGMIERKEFIEGSGYGKEDLDEMRQAWLESKDARKHDLSAENLKRMLDEGMMPVWLPPARRKRKRYAKYYKVVLGLIARFRM